MSGWNGPEYNSRRWFSWPSVSTQAPPADRFDGSPPTWWIAGACFCAVFAVIWFCVALCKKGSKECNDEDNRGTGRSRAPSRPEGSCRPAAIQPVIIDIPASFTVTPSAPPAPYESLGLPSAPPAPNMPDDDPPPPYPGTPTKTCPPETRFST